MRRLDGAQNQVPDTLHVEQANPRFLTANTQENALYSPVLQEVVKCPSLNAEVPLHISGAAKLG